MTKILVLDMVPSLRSHIINMLQQTIGEMGELSFVEAEDLETAENLLAQENPDFVILDITIGGKSAIRLVESIWRQSPHTKIFVWTLSMQQNQVHQLTTLLPELTCFGYIFKTASDEKLHYALESVFLHNNTYIDPVMRASFAKQQAKGLTLTDAEQETLNDLVSGLTDKAIGIKRGLTVRGVQNRLASLSSKLLARQHEQLQKSYGTSILNPRTRIIFEALRRGLIDVTDFDEIDRELQQWLDQAQDTFDATPNQGPDSLQCAPTSRNKMLYRES